MYSWGYIKENTLSKLNIDETTANQHGFLSRFPYQANEAMTQACSIKPNPKVLEVEVFDKDIKWQDMLREFNLTETTVKNNDVFWKKWDSLSFVDKQIVFPTDFISFGDDVAEYKSTPIMIGNQIVNTPVFEEAGDALFVYSGYNSVICKHVGTYRIPYNARWFLFTKELQNNVIIPAPVDILECLPSYMASQCLKIDDEQKSAIFRNEFEIFLARIDDSDFKSQKTLTIKGGW